MPVQIPRELRRRYLAYFSDSNQYKAPSRDYDEYNVADDFFSNITHARRNLEALLDGILTPLPESHTDLGEDVYTEITVSGHAKVRQVPGQDPEKKLLIGQSPFMLVKGEHGVEKAIEQGKEADPDAIVFSSDSPRAIHHALLKYHPELREKLDKIADRVDRQFKEIGTIKKRTHQHLINLALQNGIIPTPMRSHYHGERDLHPEAPDNFAGFFDTDVCKKIYEGQSKEQIEALLEEHHGYAVKGRSPLQSLQKDGKTVTEDLLLYTHRISQFLRVIGSRYKHLKGRRVNIVGHSSNIDAISAYYRNLKGGIEKAPKAATRGKERIIKLDSQFNWLNDPKLFYPHILNDQETRIKDRRGCSLDEAVRAGKRIVATPLVARRLKKGTTNEYEMVPVGLVELADVTGKPGLVVADGGHGKSTLAMKMITDINEGLASGGKRVGVYAHCYDIRQLRTKRAEDVAAYLSNLFTPLHSTLIADHEYVYAIDGYESVGQRYKDHIRAALVELAKNERNHVNLFSRPLNFSPAENGNSDFSRTVMIDTDAIANNVDAFLDGRLDDSTRREEFKKSIEVYSPKIRGTFQKLHFLLRLYTTPEKALAYVTRQDTFEALREGKPLTPFQIGDATHDLMLGEYLETKPQLSDLKEAAPAQIRRIILATKRHMSEMARANMLGEEGLVHVASFGDQYAGSDYRI